MKNSYLFSLLFGLFYNMLTPVTFHAEGDGAGGSGDGEGGEGNKSGQGGDDKKFTQEELDRIVADRVARAEKKYEGIDPAEHKRLKDEEQKRQQDYDKKKGNFEKVLKETVETKDKEINTLRDELRKERVDNRLLREASEQKALAPDQVVTLLKPNVHVTDKGDIEVLDDKGSPRYNGAEPYKIKDLVGEFLEKNPHYLPAGPRGSGSGGSGGGKGSAPIALKDLDMSKPEHRKIYKEHYRKEGSPA
ncbi:MAG: hypothetical protein MI685_03575 [Chlorobiales bacterium]|nr:hypothetical protein [Chlorobiales bacterium]